jgi:hypothetical protein
MRLAIMVHSAMREEVDLAPWSPLAPFWFRRPGRVAHAQAVRSVHHPAECLDLLALLFDAFLDGLAQLP